MSRELRSNFSNDAEGVEISILIAKYIGLLEERILVESNAFNKEKHDFFTTHPIFSLVSPCTLSNDLQWEVDNFFKYTGTGFSTTEPLNNTYKWI